MQAPLLSQKAARFTESVIRGMSIEAAKRGGQPGPGDARLPRAGRDQGRRLPGDRGRYQPVRDHLGRESELRRAIAEHAAWHLGLAVDPDTEITVTCGSTEAMLVALLSLINPGDEVILSEPFYENYWPDCVLAGATPDSSRFARPAGPSTPTSWPPPSTTRPRPSSSATPTTRRGPSSPASELEQIAALCRKWDVIAITDEIYEHILFDGRPHVALATARRDARADRDDRRDVQDLRRDRLADRHDDRPDRALTHAFRQVHDYVSIGAAAPLQAAGAVAYRLPRSYYDQLAIDYQRRRDRLCPALLEIGFDLEPPQGAYYVMAGIEAFGATDDVAFSRNLVQEIGVATVPGSSFFHQKDRGVGGYVRFCFCKRDETLDTAIDRLRQLEVVA